MGLRSLPEPILTKANQLIFNRECWVAGAIALTVMGLIRLS